MPAPPGLKPGVASTTGLSGAPVEAVVVLAGADVGGVLCTPPAPLVEVELGGTPPVGFGGAGRGVFAVNSPILVGSLGGAEEVGAINP